MKNRLLELFLLEVENKENPAQETLAYIAAGLKKMQNGDSFKAAFNLKDKRGRKSLMGQGLSEIDKLMEAIEHYNGLREQGIKGVTAKGLVCDKYGFEERTFSKHLRNFNKLKPLRDAAQTQIQLIVSDYKQAIEVLMKEEDALKTLQRPRTEADYKAIIEARENMQRAESAFNEKYKAWVEITESEEGQKERMAKIDKLIGSDCKNKKKN
jgi:hypothetical protein